MVDAHLENSSIGKRELRPNCFHAKEFAHFFIRWQAPISENTHQTNEKVIESNYNRKCLSVKEHAEIKYRGEGSR